MPTNIRNSQKDKYYLIPPRWNILNNQIHRAESWMVFQSWRWSRYKEWFGGRTWKVVKWNTTEKRERRGHSPLILAKCLQKGEGERKQEWGTGSLELWGQTATFFVGQEAASWEKEISEQDAFGWWPPVCWLSPALHVGPLLTLRIPFYINTVDSYRGDIS